MTKQTDAARLLEKYRAGNCTEAEKAILMNWFQEFRENEPISFSDAELEEVQQNISTNIQSKTKGRIQIWKPLAAAIFLITCGASLFYYQYQQKSPALTTQQLAGTDIPPGSDKAVLTLADGSKITLDQRANGIITEQKGVKVTKLADGQLSYTVEGLAAQGTNTNTIETPAAGQYQLNLPDGTKVWLNSASSLKYPVRFNGKSRNVTLSGEAYFEVAKSKTMPFIVHTKGNRGLEQEILVLGTHFNVNAYQDNATIKTTLIEGSVEVNSAAASGLKRSALLRPGQQSVLDQNLISVHEADTESIIGWKNGLFVFDNHPIKEAMKQVSRWYDVEVVYQGDFENIKVGGTISRKYTLKQTLRLLELTGKFKFKTQGRRIAVTN